MGFAVDLDTHVAIALGFGGRDDSQMVAVASEVGNLGFGGQFGGFDHCCFGFNDLLLSAILTKSFSDRYI